MKTPYEIKKGLQHCCEDGCKGCPYEDDCNMADALSILAYDALAYIQQLEEAQPKWISVKDRLPETDNDVLVYIENDDIDIMDTGYYNGYWTTYAATSNRVTHWMPMPEPPKEG